MNNRRVVVIVEGQTELTFVRNILAPELGCHGIFMMPSLIGKPGHKGGNVRFERAVKDIERFLRQESNTFVTTMFDYFRIGHDWPGRNDVRPRFTAAQKAVVMEDATAIQVANLCPDLNVPCRFLPYLAMHEFEALLFSEARTLADGLNVSESTIAAILSQCGEPEEINEGADSSPSKRILTLNRYYRKVAMGTSIAERIGIARMREACPHFNRWLSKLNDLQWPN